MACKTQNGKYPALEEKCPGLCPRFCLRSCYYKWTIVPVYSHALYLCTRSYSPNYSRTPFRLVSLHQFCTLYWIIPSDYKHAVISHILEYKTKPSSGPSYSTSCCPLLNTSLQWNISKELPTLIPLLLLFLELTPTLKLFLLTSLMTFSWPDPMASSWSSSYLTSLQQLTQSILLPPSAFTPFPHLTSRTQNFHISLPPPCCSFSAFCLIPPLLP